MKVIILTEVFFPDTIGGAGKYAYNVATGLVGNGHEVNVITRKVKDLPLEEVIDGIKILRVSWSKGANPFKLFLFLKAILKAFEEICLKNDFDLIIFNQPLSAFSVIFSKKAKAVPKIYNFQASWADEFAIKSFLKHRPYMPQVILKRIILFPVLVLMKLIERTVVLNSDKIITLSHYVKNRLQYLYGVPDEKIKIIPPGVDVDKFKPLNIEERESLRKSLGIGGESFILFTARNLVPRMGLNNLILAFNILARKKTNVKLLIAGGGFLEKRLKLLTKRLCLLERVRFLGEISEDFLIKYFQASDLFILPTQFLEGFGIATIEALACGLPVLGTPVGGTIEILDKFNKNALFSSAEAESMAEKILEFIEDVQDKSLFSKRCRQFILDNYSLVKFSQEIEKFYQSVA